MVYVPKNIHKDISSNSGTVKVTTKPTIGEGVSIKSQTAYASVGHVISVDKTLHEKYLEIRTKTQTKKPKIWALNQSE